MKIRTLFSAWGPKSLCLAALLISGCGTEQKVRKADEAYQMAMANNDLAGQRRALLALTVADEDVSDYWMRLARVELEMGAYRDAYIHLSRAHELDRTAVAPLSMMTELAVINGRLDMAEDHLKQLMVVAPNDRAVAVARGFVALRQANFERAQENVDVLLTQNPGDSIANVLQTRILIAQKKFPEAVEFLDRKLALGTNDRSLLRSLAAVHRYLGNWDKAAATDLRLWRFDSSDAQVARQLVGDALQAKNIDLATDITKRILISAKSREEIDSILSAWKDHAPGTDPFSTSIDAKTPDHSRIAFAHYLNWAGRADQAFKILGGSLRPMDDRANAAFNAVFAESLFFRGQVSPARQILDRILSNEPDNAVALSARARVRSQSGDHRGATIDAQRLVTGYGTNADYRVLLADVYRASRNTRWAERTLWDGYRDLRGNETLYREVRRVLAARADSEALSRLESDHHDGKFSRLMKELA